MRTPERRLGRKEAVLELPVVNAAGVVLQVRLVRPYWRFTLEFFDAATGECIVCWDALDFAGRARAMAASGPIPLSGKDPNRWCLDAASVDAVGAWVLCEAAKHA